MSAYRDDIKGIAGLDLPWEKLSGRSILVTGAAGLIGGCLVESLLSVPGLQCDIYAMTRTPSPERFAHDAARPDGTSLHFITHDVTEPLDCGVRFDYIIHAASPACPAAFSSHPVEVMKANFLGVSNLFEYGLAHGLKRLLYVSSGEIYGEGEGQIFTENSSGYVDCTLPRACYPSSKRAAETLCASYADEYGAEAVIARPCHVYGPHFTERDNRVYAQFIRNVAAGEDILMKGDGGQLRSWCYVVDCVSALLHILLKGVSCQAYNVADSASVITIGELASLVARIAGRRVIAKGCGGDAGGSTVRMAVFDTSRLEGLGWSVAGTMEDKMRATIEERMALGGAAR